MCNTAVSYWPGKAKREGTNVKLRSKDGAEFEVHISRPEGDPPYATVVIIPDYFDPELYYYDLADQYAAAGYLGVTFDPFARQGKLSEQSHPAASARIPNVGDDQLFDDFDAVLDHLRKEGLLGSLAVSGFCWGGRMAYLVAARHPEVKVLIPFYGHLTAWGGNKPYAPLDEADSIGARVIGSYGGGDDSIPVDGVQQMEQKLRDKGVSAELKVYPGAPHCFFRTPEWSKDSDDAWQRVLTGLKESLA